MLQPLLKPASTASRRHTFHSAVQFCQRNDNEENSIFLGGFHPTNDPDSAAACPHSETALVSRRKLID
jgi:hypothetical protein